MIVVAVLFLSFVVVAVTWAVAALYILVVGVLSEATPEWMKTWWGKIIIVSVLFPIRVFFVIKEKIWRPRDTCVGI